MAEGISITLLVILVVYYTVLYIRWYKYKNPSEQVVEDERDIDLDNAFNSKLEECLDIINKPYIPTPSSEETKDRFDKYIIENERRQDEEYLRLCEFVRIRRAEGFAMRDPIKGRAYGSSDDLIISSPHDRYRRAVPRPQPNPLANSNGMSRVHQNIRQSSMSVGIHRPNHSTNNTSHVDNSSSYNNFYSSSTHDDDDRHHHSDSDCGSSDYDCGGSSSDCGCGSDD